MELKMQEKMLQYIDAHEAEMIDLWRKLVYMESPSNNKKAVDAVGHFLADYAKEKLGYYVRFTEDEVLGNCLALCSCPFDEYKHGIAISAHMDTVHDVGSFDPVLVEDDEYMYGPGVADCKGGITMALLTAMALKEIGYNKRPVKLVFSGAHENGGAVGKKFYLNEFVGSDYVFSTEPGMRDKVVTGRKSSIIVFYNIKGEAAHIGRMTGKPKSAIREAAMKLLALENASDYDTLTFCCGIINGGHAPTSVPANCQLQVNVRIKDSSVIDKAMKTLHEVAETTYVPGTSTEMVIHGNSIPMSERPANNILCEYFSQISQSLGYASYEHTFVGGASDASYAVSLGIPSICAVGPVGEFHHTKNERAMRSNMAVRAKIHAKAIVDMPDDLCAE